MDKKIQDILIVIGIFSFVIVCAWYVKEASSENAVCANDPLSYSVKKYSSVLDTNVRLIVQFEDPRYLPLVVDSNGTRALTSDFP